jgi:Transcriptional regulatory protein, C terminal
MALAATALDADTVMPGACRHAIAPSRLELPAPAHRHVSKMEMKTPSLDRTDGAGGAHVALIDDRHGDGGRLLGQLRRMGHDAVAFAGPTSFLAALSAGEHFDLLLVVVEDELTRRSLFAVCRTLELPTLLVVRTRQWAQLASWHGAPGWDDLIEFDEVPSESATTELEWRLRALLSKQRPPRNAPAATSGFGAWGDYRFLGTASTVLHRHRSIRLQPRQYAFALTLFRHLGQVVTREWLWQSVWQTPTPRAGARVLDVCATNVRSRLDLRAENGFVLRAVYGQGYQIVAVPAEPAQP